MIKKISLTILAIILLALLAGYLWMKSTAPTYSGQISLDGISDDVEVKYDAYGIPHIYATNGPDCYHALGYVHAQDRLFQMEMIRRLASGRLSEILGESMVDADRYFRTLGVRRMAEITADSLLAAGDSEMRVQVKAYLAGVNEYLHYGPTPIEYRMIGIPKEDFTEADIYTILGYMGLGFTLAIKEEPEIDKIHRLLGDPYLEDWEFVKSSTAANYLLKSTTDIEFLQGEATDYMNQTALPIWEGSNGWVLGPSKSKSGKVLFANDTHIGTSQPSVWYEAHLNYPGFEFYGNYLAGVPFGVLGHNRDISYGLTIFPADMVDMYRERQNPDNPNQLWVDDHWEDLIIQTDTIKVKDSDPIYMKRKVSRHGPIINEVSEAIRSSNSEPISLWWNYLERPTKTLSALYKLNNSHNIDQARAGVSEIDFIALNVLYGDAEGNIAHWGAGRIAHRPDHVNSKVILDGASGADELLGFYDFSENPSNENPIEGYVASANNDPYIVKDKYIPGYYCPDNRINRIRQYLDNQEQWSQEDMKAIQLDVISDDHKEIAHAICTVLKDGESNAHSQANLAIDALSSWDGSYELNKIEPTIYTKLVYHVMRLAITDEIGEVSFNTLQPSYLYKGSIKNIIANDKSVWWDDISTTNVVEKRSMIIRTAMSITIKELTEQLGSEIEDWKWHLVHTIEHVHPIGRKKPFDKLFNVGPFPVTGGNDVPNKMMYVIDGSGAYKTTSCPAVRIVLDFADVEASESINPTGQSGNPMSRHYDDQARMFLDGIYRPQLMNHKDIEEKGRFLLLRARN